MSTVKYNRRIGTFSCIVNGKYHLYCFNASLLGFGDARQSSGLSRMTSNRLCLHSNSIHSM